MLSALRQQSGVRGQEAAAVYAAIGPGEEHYGKSGAAALLLDLPAAGYRLFAGDSQASADLAATDPDWLAAAEMLFSQTHFDPRHSEAAGASENLASTTGGFFMGGLTASRTSRAGPPGGSAGSPSRSWRSRAQLP